MKLITLDFETYYDKAYSLSKITTEEYVRSPQFETIGVAVAIDNAEPVWYSGTKENIKGFLLGLNLHENAVVAHNARFDVAILTWVFGIKPKAIIDTLSMARAIHGTEVGGSLAKLAEHYKLGVKGTEVVQALGKHRIDFAPDEMARYAEYCRNDVALTRDLFAVLAHEFPKSELKLIDLTIRMFTEPVLKLDLTLLGSHLERVQVDKQDLLNIVGKTKEELRKNEVFADLLRTFGVEPPTKISDTTGKEAYAFAKTDEEFIALEEHEEPMVQALVAARLGTKSTLEEKRTERFISIAGRGTLPIPLRYYAAHTGRWGGDDKINMQNLPRGSTLKHAIQAPDGYVMIDSDSSQIEARVLAWLSEQNDLVDAFERGEDVYKMMASSIYGKEVKEINKQERFMGKTTILGAGYGMGAVKFKVQLKRDNVDLPEEECKRIIDVYRGTYEWIPTLWQQAQRALVAMIDDKTAPLGRPGILVVEGRKGIRLPNGLYVKYPNLRKQTDPKTGKDEYVYDTYKGKTPVPTRIYGGKVIENVCQALARIAIGEQMLMIAKKYKVTMTVHDSVGVIVPEAEKDTGLEYVQMCMRIRPKWAPDLPLNCEAGSGKSYGEC